MPNLREIKGHIGSVRSIAKVTRAMEMVSTARNHRLQTRVASTRAFAERSWEVLNHLASAAESVIHEHPMFCGYSNVNRTGMLLITSDRGMAGAYDHNVVSLATQYIESRNLKAELITIGKMGRTMMLREDYQIHAEFSSLSDKVDITDLTPVARVLLDGFRDRVFDEAVICYTEFQSGARLKPTIRQLLPICPGEAPTRREYIYEPDPAELLQALLPRLIRFQIFQAFLESLAAENTSRMVAMHAATQSANDIIGNLTISYNKARQQAITAEINDIFGGTSALDKD